jgi:3-hydroxyisobutyryl-CoA hydrolase
MNSFTFNISIDINLSTSSEYGFATHFIPSRRIPMLLDRLAELDQPHPSLVDHTLEELSSERDDSEPPALFTGRLRVALDSAFSHSNVERIFKDLTTLLQDDDATVRQWASDSLEMLAMRSPTSLKVALKAIRQGKRMTLREALEMELKIASAFCVSDDSDLCFCFKSPLFRAGPVLTSTSVSRQYLLKS